MRTSALRRICSLALTHGRPPTTGANGIHTWAAWRTSVETQQGVFSLCEAHIRQGLPSGHCMFFSATATESKETPSETKTEGSAEKSDSELNSKEASEKTVDEAKEESAKAEGSGKEAAGLEGEELQKQIETMTAELKGKQDTIEELKLKNEELQERVLRTLAESENMKQRITRQAEQAKKYAVQDFVKALLDVADNLERATESVPEDESKLTGEENLKKLLNGLLEGVKLTDQQLMQVFKMNGVAKFRPTEEKFDPNRHSALFEVPDPSKEPGQIAAVTKSGYTMHDRVIRPAEVGVVKAQEDAAAQP